MKILVSTSKTQGARENDFCWVPEGEPLMLGFECDSGSVDDKCGCRRGMVGIKCLKATSTALVVESEMARDEFVELVVAGDKESGFNLHREDLVLIADTMLGVARNFPVGTVLERRGELNFRTRKQEATQ